jgi:hypothetical protein
LKELGMQQRFRRVALFVGAASLVSAGFVMVACGTDNGDPVATPTVDSGKADTGNKTDGNVDPVDSSVPDSGPDADCSNNPQLRDNSAGFRCAFKSQDAGGADASPLCENNQECCNTESKATGPGYCANGKNGSATLCQAQAPGGSTWTDKGKVWECADKSACGQNEVCCMISDPAQAPDVVNIGKTLPSDTRHPQACNVARVFKEGGSRCKTSCDSKTEIKLCSLTDNNCGAGTVCTPFVDFTNFVDRGYCK